MNKHSRVNLDRIFKEKSLKVKKVRFPRFKKTRSGPSVVNGKFPYTKYSSGEGEPSWEGTPDCLWQLGKKVPYKQRNFQSVTGGDPRTTINRVIRHNSKALGIEYQVYSHKKRSVRLDALKCVSLATLHGPFISARLWLIFNYGVKCLRTKSPKLKCRGNKLLQHFVVKFLELDVDLGTFSSMRKSGSFFSKNEHPEDVISSENSDLFEGSHDDTPDDVSQVESSSPTSYSSDY